MEEYEVWCFGAGWAVEQVISRSSPVCRTDGRRCFSRHHVSHTARSGQAPHTPGGTKVLLDPTTAGPPLQGAARSRTLQEGLRSITGRSGDILVFGSDWRLAHVAWPVSLGTLRRYRAVGVRSLRGLD